MLDCHIVKARSGFTVTVQFSVGSSRLALFGPSGSGKSTILSCLAGIETPDDGYIKCGGQTWFPPAIALHRRSVGYLTQKERLFPHLSVGENVLFALNGVARQEQSAWIQEVCDRLALGSLWEARASELSGGQARRVALARTLCRKPALVLLDEPFAGLDRPLVRELAGVLKDWQRELGFTLLAVDHDPLVLETLCPDVIAVEQGQMIQRGSWDQLADRPASPVLRALLDKTP